MRGLSFMADGEFFAADVTLVQKVSRNMAVTPVPAAPSEVTGIANLKGKVVTVLNLAALLGRDPDKSGAPEIRGIRHVSAVVFKSFTEGDDQMGLLIDKPGDLIDIDENKILPLTVAAESEERLCISGMAEIEGTLYRIININSIINKFNDADESSADIISDSDIKYH